MSAIPMWLLQARRMLENAGVYREDRVESLALDLEALCDEMMSANEGYDPEPTAVVALLNQRIGGLKNLESYSDCLLAGAKRGAAK